MAETRQRQPRQKREPKESKETKPAKDIKPPRDSRPQTTPEGREQQLIALAVDLAEKQLREGTASPSVINHYLKMASTRETIEREMMKKQSTLIDAKVEAIVKGKEQEELAKAALNAMKNYTSGAK